MRRLFCILFVICVLLTDVMTVSAKDEPKNLHAQSAVLIDAESGRVLFAKNADEKRAMASTTKIMTCILSLEHGVNEVVTVSKKAANQPRVRLGVNEGERYKLIDLLYSLMLESHNDVAVAIAEHLAGSVEKFATLMNEKAKMLGCNNTHFITPNGLDATDEGGIHSTTATELAKIMRYCVMQSPKKEEFREITKTPSYSFTTVDGKRRFQCYNHNAFLTMMEGAFSGKTGFTGDAGYCYVGALNRDERTYIVALLGCGWPNHKNYKWQDTKKLMKYGIENFHYQNFFDVSAPKKVRVVKGIDKTYVSVRMSDTKEEREEKLRILMCDTDELTTEVCMEPVIEAPIKKGQKVGRVLIRLNHEIVEEKFLVAQESVRRKNYRWFLIQTIAQFFVQKEFDFAL